MLRLRPLGTLLTIALVSLSACGPSMSGGAEASSQVSTAGGTAITVRNNLTVPTVLTILLVSSGGVRNRIGLVPGGETRTLHYGSGGAGTYRLAATTAAGEALLSDTFTLSGSDQITWDLRSNIITNSR
ncbi:MAG TPA: hypothetical protein VFE05_01765 [Longimicrobiaceae bacterium]|jgi:hypothetical protein|nr:hypothetical protein [Longimicrobiaceae bacterium]